MRWSALLLLVTGVTGPLSAQQATGCAIPQDACRFFDYYLSAFNRRDWSAFVGTFDDSITVMFDRPASPERRSGRAAVEEMFRRVFPAPGRQLPQLPPPITPESLVAQDFGSVVVVSFHIRSSGELARRTVVLRNNALGWRVVHIHASSADLPVR